MNKLSLLAAAAALFLSGAAIAEDHGHDAHEAHDYAEECAHADDKAACVEEHKKHDEMHDEHHDDHHGDEDHHDDHH